jgi:hypothetical protein
MKIIIIDNNRYVLPEGMPTKDVQALAGFLITLTKVNYEYCFGQADTEYAYYEDGGANISVTTLNLVAKEEAKRLADDGRTAYQLKQANKEKAETQ